MSYWSRAGLAATLQMPDQDWPPSPQPGIGDIMGGLPLAGGISAALVRRALSGGDVIEVPAVPTRFDGATHPSLGAPEHGQHTEEVLLELGLGFDDILDLKARGTVL